MKRLLHTLLAVLVLASFMSCSSAQKHLNAGQYEQAIEMARKKLIKKKDKEKYVQILSDAWNKSLSHELSRIDYLKAQNDPANWTAIYNSYLDLQRTMLRIEPLLPLYLDEGWTEVDFNFPNLDAAISNARTEAADHLYTNAQRLLRDGGKLEAREAFDQLQSLSRLFTNYKDTNQLLVIAEEKGISKVSFQIDNRTRIRLPEEFEQQLSSIDFYQLNSRWVNFYSNAHAETDYHIELIVRGIDVGSNALDKEVFIQEKEVSDGFQYVLDDDGNVTQDSLGNDIKVERFIDVTCKVKKFRQFKVAHISGDVVFKDKLTNRELGRFPVAADAIFENVYATAFGDLRALDSNTKRWLNHDPVPYPHDLELLAQSGETLKPVVKDVIWDHKGLVMN